MYGDLYNVTNYLIALIGYYSAVYGVDPKLALSVAVVESRLNPTAVSERGAIGVFQLMPQSFNMPARDLFNPEVNIKLGVKYLSWNKKYCKHKVDNTWLVCYNYGIGNAARVKYPKLFPYYKQVMKEYHERY